jgi:RHS repeat-associated protein
MTNASNNPDAPDNKQVVFVQGTGTMFQTHSVTAGTYTLSFQAAQEGNNVSERSLRVTLRPSIAGVTSKRFVWCGTQICEERDSTGATVTKRFFAQGEQRIGGSDAGQYYYTRDHLGSIREVTNSHGNLLARYDYDPYGSAVVTDGNMNVDFGYTGHYFHAPSGLSLTLYRAYNPALGRWISRDPIGEAGGTNLYGYVGNDPINLWDPLGLDYHDAAFTKRLLHLAYRDALAGPFQGLLNIRSNSQGNFDFKNSGDTFCVNGKILDDAQFGNYIAGFAGQVYDNAYGSEVLGEGYTALDLVIAGGIGYHIRGAFRGDNPLSDWNDDSGIPMILQGAQAASSFPHGFR